MSMSDADVARSNGWTVGTRLAGDEGYGETVIEITAIGERCVLAKRVAQNGRPRSGRESTWTFSCRDWHVVSKATSKDYPPNVTCACGDLIHPDMPSVEIEADGVLWHGNAEGGGHRVDVTQ